MDEQKLAEFGTKLEALQKEYGIERLAIEQRIVIVPKTLEESKEEK